MPYKKAIEHRSDIRGDALKSTMQICARICIEKRECIDKSRSTQNDRTQPNRNDAFASLEFFVQFFREILYLYSILKIVFRSTPQSLEKGGVAKFDTRYSLIVNRYSSPRSFLS